jgi:hypothetical protein
MTSTETLGACHLPVRDIPANIYFAVYHICSVLRMLRTTLYYPDMHPYFISWNLDIPLAMAHAIFLIFVVKYHFVTSMCCSFIVVAYCNIYRQY